MYYLGGYYNHPWNHIIHEPYLEAGLPNLINRPFSNSLAKANKIIEMARKYKAPLLVPSSHEHNESIARAKVWATGKNIICYSATNSFDDYPTHGIHGLYLCCKAIAEAGNPVTAVSYRADSWYSAPGVLTFEHRNKEGKPFFGTLHQVAGSWGTIQIHTPEVYGGESFNIYYGTGYPYNKTEIWATPIWAFQNMASLRRDAADSGADISQNQCLPRRMALNPGEQRKTGQAHRGSGRMGISRLIAQSPG